MLIGIDASNIRRGGGITHLRELLVSAKPELSGIKKVFIWSCRSTLDQIEDRPWLEKIHLPILEKNFVIRGFWQRLALSNLARSRDCDLLYVPGGSFAGDFKPVVSFSQNLLPFEWRELSRFGFSGMMVKMLLLRIVQSQTFRNSTGVVYLTKYSKIAVEKVINVTPGRISIIAHGVDHRFNNKPRVQKELNTYSLENPLRIIYVSIIDVYKHQWNVVEAIAKLRKEGLPVCLELVGQSTLKGMTKLQKVIMRHDPEGEFVQYDGAVPFQELHHKYSTADIAIFASSCENMPNILLESMASGLPIACSDRGPMPEILMDAGVYFDPEKPSSIAKAVSTLLNSAVLRQQKSELAYSLSQTYSWEKCAVETFNFLRTTALSCQKGEINV